MRKSVARQATGLIINVIQIEDGAIWSPPKGCILMDGGEIGDTWDGTHFIKPIPPVLVPPQSTHIATLLSVTAGAAKPVRIRRAWQGANYDYDAYATEHVKSEYQAGKIAIGNTLVVEFFEGETISPVVMAKVIV